METIFEERTDTEASPQESATETAINNEKPEKDVKEETRNEYKKITWWDLLSKEENAFYKDLNAKYEADSSFTPTTDPPAVGINPDMNELKIAIPGFIVGVDSDPGNFAMVNSFLFVPYQGACIHVPPPPTNQTVFVTVDDSFQSNPYEPYWLYGTISTEEGNNDLAAYSYTLKGDRLEIYSE